MSEPSAAAAGKVILLNGASSSGKSTLARAIQARIGEPFWHISIDHLRDAGVLPSARIKSGEFKWAEIRGGFFAGFERSLIAYLDCGNNLIVEYIMENREWLQRTARLLKGYDVFFVGVHCSLEELERREIARADRPVGDARRDYHAIHAYCAYDAEFDSTLLPDENAERLIALWLERPRPSALEEIAAAGA